MNLAIKNYISIYSKNALDYTNWQKRLDFITRVDATLKLFL